MYELVINKVDEDWSIFDKKCLISLRKVTHKKQSNKIVTSHTRKVRRNVKEIFSLSYQEVPTYLRILTRRPVRGRI